MVESEYVSRKMRVLSLFAAVTIVFLHSGIMPGMEHQASWCRWTVDFLTQRLTCWAVPLFFAMAGYWFARGRYDGYGVFLKKKVRGLLIPYVCFALIALVVSTPVVIASNLAAHRALWTNTVFAGGTVWSALNDIFALTIVEPKQLGVLWFIRTLFILFLLAPVYRWLLNRCVWVFAVFGFGMLAFCPGCDIPGFPIWFGAALWFYLGVFVGGWREGALVTMRLPFPCALGLLALAVGSLFLPIPECLGYCRKLLFILGFWFVADGVLPHLPNPFPRWVGWSFWLYCTHNIFLLYLLAAARFIVGRADAVIVLLPFVATAVALVLSLGMAGLLNRFCPRLFAVLTGGR